MLEQMTGPQLVEWAKYDALHPFGDLRTEMEYAYLKWTMANMMSETDATLSDFMWSWFQDDAVKDAANKARVAEKTKRALGL